LGMSIVSNYPRIGLKMSVNSPRSDILLFFKAADPLKSYPAI
jgi:hypothetical protein